MLASAILAPYQSTPAVPANTNHQPTSKFPQPQQSQGVDPSDELAQAVNRYLLHQIGEQTRNYETLFERVLKGEKGFNALVNAQKNAILWADMLNQPALIQDLQMYESTGASQSVISHRMALAEPLVERIRLAYLFVFSANCEFAKKAIEEAACIEVPYQALLVQRVAEIFEGTKTLRDLMTLAQEDQCVEILFQECDMDRDGLITAYDLELAKGRDCGVPHGILSFLQTKSEVFGSAINRAELKAYLRSNWLYDAFKQLIC